MKKVYHICELVHGCLGASGYVRRLEGAYTSEAAAKKKIKSMCIDFQICQKVYFVEWEWVK